ncbi:MAG: SDR family oxidoreductase [Hyphomicrobiales bacterium]|nr:SDR family oxidoreductase [Hyphomicrobiales bacterium]
MDLGIEGRKAIVCAASAGLGFACANQLAAEGVDVTIIARRDGPLQAAAETIRSAHECNVTAVAGDITSEEGRAAVLDACPNPDILVNNAGGPPPGSFRDWGRDDWIDAVDSNMISPILMIKATVDGMIERRFGRIVNITSGAVKAPIPTLGLSNGARAGLTGFVAGLARQVAEHNVTINNLMPGPFATARLEKTLEGAAKAGGIDIEEARKRRRNSIPARRFGDPDEFGLACAYLCAARSGYVTGQSLLLDGGSFPGML